MHVIQAAVGGKKNFAYIVTDEETLETMLIDPSFNPHGILNIVNERLFKLKYVINTHSHSGHTNGNEEIRKIVGIEAIGYGGIDPFSQEKIADGHGLYLGKSRLEVLHTPGHTRDSICLLTDEAMFTGDTLFVGAVGKTESDEQALALYASLKEKIINRPENIRLYPGHDYGSTPYSTIGEEMRNTPAWQQTDGDSFLAFVKATETGT